MSNEKIEQYLKRHHCHDYFNAYGDSVQDDHYFLYREEIDELIKLIKNDEREACAKVCERLPETFKIAADEFSYEAEIPTAENYAAAIRTRDDT